MLATAEQVKQAMNLDTRAVRKALENAGYGADEIIDSRFKGFNGTQFVYEITYPNPEDEGTATGNIYISLKRRAFEAAFEFYGDF
jgi:hypothetical protein